MVTQYESVFVLVMRVAAGSPIHAPQFAFYFAQTEPQKLLTAHTQRAYKRAIPSSSSSGSAKLLIPL